MATTAKGVTKRFTGARLRLARHHRALTQTDLGALVGVSHQFIGKPCDPDALRVAIERACELQSRLGDPAIQRVVGRLDRLPSVPRTRTS